SKHSGRRAFAIACGESDSKAEPMRLTDPNGFRDLWDPCEAASVPFFFKQVGDWTHDGLLVNGSDAQRRTKKLNASDPRQARTIAGGGRCYRLSKRINGRELNGREWNQLPRPGGAN
ncbi:MAG: DUF5131 family protein, partial [Myxococcaceae bacterium]